MLGGIVVLYLYDAALLLFHNELVLIVGRKSGRVSAGSDFELRGRHVFMPSLLHLAQPVFRISWPHRPNAMRDKTELPRLRRIVVGLKLLGPWIAFLQMLFILGLPACLFVWHSDAALLAWLLVVYAVIGGALLHTYRRPKMLNLSRRAVFAIALDALLCAPFALNLVCKISLRQRLGTDLGQMAVTWLPPSQQRLLGRLLRTRVETSLASIEPATDEAHTLLAYLNEYEEVHT